MTGPSPERWDEMKERAYKDLFRRLAGDNIWTPPTRGEQVDSITYPVRSRRTEQEVLSDSQPSAYGRRVSPSYLDSLSRINKLIADTYNTDRYLRPGYQDICPRCGQDRNRVRHCDPSAGFRREGFQPEPKPVRLSFGDDEVIDGEVLAVDQPELEQ